MGSGSSKPSHHQDSEDSDDDYRFTETALAQRAEDIRYRFPIDSPIDKAVDFSYTALISPDSPPLLPTLPPELIEEIVSFLDNASIKNLRLTCRHFSAIKLRINRVFLSANPLNIRVLRSIADHDEYRQGIVELIYDDARLYHSRADQGDNALLRDISIIDYDGPETTLEWFHAERDVNLHELGNRQTLEESSRPKDFKVHRQVHAELSLEESWTYYQELLRQQDDVIARGADIEAFRYALQQFPALQTVTVTPAAHGWLFTPLYETPMIRAFPYGFNYPIPRGWPVTRLSEIDEKLAPWEDSKARWRGYCLVTKILAEERQHHRVSELRIDSHLLHSGLSCRLFEQSSPEYLDFVTCLQHPSLKKLHLSLYVEFHVDFPWTAFRRNLLRNALANASQLEHFSLETGLDETTYAPHENDNHELPPVLRTILPVNCWTGLQHFRLWNYPVNPVELISILSEFPALQSLELGFLFLQSGTQHEFLVNMRDTLRWHERPTHPKVRYAVPIPSDYVQGRAIWIDEEIEKFLYRGGENPLEAKRFVQVCYDMGVMKDAFDPKFERPYLHPKKERELIQSGAY
ncbi:hypothetical protein HDV64DRAFT_240990, partial [Trichoderma sp. TUCIM 5745]